MPNHTYYSIFRHWSISDYSVCTEPSLNDHWTITEQALLKDLIWLQPDSGFLLLYYFPFLRLINESKEKKLDGQE